MEYLRRRWTKEPEDSCSHVLPDPMILEEASNETILEYIPIRFLENRIQALSRTSVPHDLGRLRQHRENIEELREKEDWRKLHMEQMNASRTVQQLIGHLHSLDELRQQVTPRDRTTFDSFTDIIRAEILSAVEDYQTLMSGVEGEVVSGDEGEKRGEGEGDEKWLLLADSKADHYQSMEDLRTELLELNGLVQELNTSISQQSTSVSMINSRTENAMIGIKGGVADLRGGQRLKTYVLPVGGGIMGGLLGGVVGGPVGSIVGLKIGALLAATASTAGIVGGAIIGYRVSQHKAGSAETIEREEQTKKNKKDE